MFPATDCKTDFISLFMGFDAGRGQKFSGWYRIDRIS